MKIAISSSGPDLDSQVDPRFGRCQYFMIVDPDDMSFEAVPNGNLAQGSGVGIQSAKVVADKGAKAVLTGNVGPNAHRVLSEAGLDVMTGVSGTVREATKRYKNGELKSSDKPNAQKFLGSQTKANQLQGSWPQQVPGIGFGMGRGIGCGRGMGMGRGMGRGLCGTSRMPSEGQITRKEELTHLKEDARMLGKQMEEIQRRIKELEHEKSDR